MKRILPFFLLWSICFAGCDKNVIDDSDDGFILWDFPCSNVIMNVTDETGQNLVDPESFGDIVNEDVYIMYRGVKYKLKRSLHDDPDETRMLMPVFNGLYLTKSSSGGWVLAFGEFSPSRGYINEPFTIYWGDGTKDEITFDLYITWESKTEPVIHRTVSLNGKAVGQDYYFVVQIIK